MRVLVIGDSTAFHGPERPMPLTDERLYPNVLATLLGGEADTVARLGWTARDAWWALTRDPHVWSVLLPRADVVVLGVGGMDQLPVALPTYLRAGLDHLRPGWLRRAGKRAYHRANPYAVRALRGTMRALPQRATDHYLTRCVQALRALRPEQRLVGIVPPPFDAAFYGHVTVTHAPAVAAAKRWGAANGVPMADLDAAIAPFLARGDMNPDGMHWTWAGHAAVAAAIHAALDRPNGVN